MSNRFMKGAIILSLSMFLTRILGLLYVIPFQRLVGERGLALYAYAYVPYSLLLTLSTLGIPVGIAKFVSKYNADGEYDTSRKIFRYGMIFMIILGLIGFLIMWFSAPWFARKALSGDDLYNTLEDVELAIRMVSFAIIVVPPMSILRGFFQGNQDMASTAISQFVEQLVRVVLVIVGAFLVVQVFDGTTQLAVQIAVFAAFVAGLSSLFVLYLYWAKNKQHFDTLLKSSVRHRRRPVSKLFKELLTYALPFAILSLISTWFQMIDTMTFNAGMMRAEVDPIIAESLFGMYTISLLKIVTIPVSFAIAFGQPLIPEVTEKVRTGDFKGVHKTLTSAILLTSFVTIPAVVGMSLLSNPLYVMLFNSQTEGLNEIGGQMFATGVFIGIFMALNSMLLAILQGIGNTSKSLIFLLIASGIKLVGNIVLIPRFEVQGAIIATILAYIFFMAMNYLEIRKRTGIETRIILKRHISIFLFTGLMSLAVWLVISVLNLFLDYTTSRLQATVYVTIAGIVGMLVYGWLAFYFDLAKLLFGDKLSYNRFRARFRRSKT